LHIDQPVLGSGRKRRIARSPSKHGQSVHGVGRSFQRNGAMTLSRAVPCATAPRVLMRAADGHSLDTT
jgi:hypothetical protein